MKWKEASRISALKKQPRQVVMRVGITEILAQNKYWKIYFLVFIKTLNT